MPPGSCGSRPNRSPGTTVDNPLPRAFGRVVLRRLVLGDLSAFQAYRQDTTVGLYQSWQPLSDDEASQLISDMSSIVLFPRGQWVQLAIGDCVTGELIGDLGICVAADRDEAEIGFTLAAAAQGRGFGSDAVRAAIGLTFDRAPVVRITAVTDARNWRAVRLLEHVGMRRVDTVAAVFRGQSCVEHVYAISRDEG